jgi:hypothetical protein
MNLEEFIINTTNIKPVYYTEESKIIQSHKIIILSKEIEYNHTFFNKIYNDLTYDGVLFIINNLPLVYQLIKNQSAIVILKEQNNISCLYKNNSSHFRGLDYIEKTKNEFYINYINWYNDYANKNIICEYRFFHHLLYNRFNTTQKFL